jgi:hypothetical protein
MLHMHYQARRCPAANSEVSTCWQLLLAADKSQQQSGDGGSFAVQSCMLVCSQPHTGHIGQPRAPGGPTPGQQTTLHCSAAINPLLVTQHINAALE